MKKKQQKKNYIRQTLLSSLEEGLETRLGKKSELTEDRRSACCSDSQASYWSLLVYSNVVHKCTPQHCTAGLLIEHQTQKYWPVKAHRRKYIEDIIQAFFGSAAGSSFDSECQSVSQVPEMHLLSDIQYWLVLIPYWYHVYLFSSPLMCCILSECMFVGRNSAKLNLVGRGLKWKFGVNP